jgi:hypothetical protein
MLTKDGSAVVLDPQGKQHLVGVLEAERLFKQGWRPQTEQGYLEGARSEVFGGAGEQVFTGLKGAMRGYTAGLSDVMFAGVGGDPTRHAEAMRMAENPGSALAGELIGAVGQGLATGGGLGSLAAKGAAKLGAQKVGTTAAQLGGLGLEGGAYSGALAATEEARGLKSQDDATSQMLLGASMGAGVGAGAMVLGKLLRLAGARVRKNYQEVRVDLDDASAVSKERSALEKEIRDITGPMPQQGYPSGQTGPFPQPGMTGPMPYMGPSGQTGPYPQQVIARGGDPLADTAAMRVGDPTAQMPAGQPVLVSQLPPEAGWTGANQAIDDAAMRQVQDAMRLGYPPSRGWTGAQQAIDDLGPPPAAGVIDQTTGQVPAMPSGKVGINPLAGRLQGRVPPNAGWTGVLDAAADATRPIPRMDMPPGPGSPNFQPLRAPTSPYHVSDLPGSPTAATGVVDDATANIRGGKRAPAAVPMDDAPGLTGPMPAEGAGTARVLPPLGGPTSNIRGGRPVGDAGLPSGQTGPHPLEELAEQVGGKRLRAKVNDASEGLAGQNDDAFNSAAGPLRRKLRRKGLLDNREVQYRVRLVRRAAEREMGRRMGGIFGFDSAYRGAGAAAGFYAGGFFPAALGFMVAPKVIDGLVIAAERGAMALANPKVQKALAHYLEPTLRKGALMGLNEYHELHEDIESMTPAQVSDAITLAMPDGTPPEVAQKIAGDAVKQVAYLKSIMPKPPQGVRDPYQRFEPSPEQLQRAGRQAAVVADPERPIRLFLRGELDDDTVSAFRDLYPDEMRDWMNLMGKVVDKMAQAGQRPDPAMQRQIAMVMDDKAYAPSIDDPAVQLYLADSFEEAMEGGVRPSRRRAPKNAGNHKTRLDQAAEEASA